jgi:propanediol dehydratase small subunit
VDLDYPLGSRRPELVTTPSGVPLAEVTLDAVRSGRISGNDLRATPETLRRQAGIALGAGRPALAANLARAAELASLPDELILEVYTALRPHRSTAGELARWAERLEVEHGAQLTAAFVADAAAVYAERRLLRDQAF